MENSQKASRAKADDEFDRMLDRARDGDNEAIGHIYHEYQPRIYRYLYRRAGDADLADDLTAAVFLKVVDAIQSGSAWNSSFTGWLYRIAHNVLSDHRRAMDRRPECSLPEGLPGSTGAAMEEKASNGYALEIVKRALDDLRPDYADVIRLRFNEGLPHAAVAAQLGKTEGAVKVAQHRALKVLRSRLVHDTAPQAA